MPKTAEIHILKSIQRALNEALATHGTPENMPRVRSIMRYLGGDISNEVVCTQCGAYFQPKRAWQRFCDNDCRNTFHSERRKAG